MSSSSNTSPLAETSLRRLDFVEALRGLAALYVFLYHLALIPIPPLDVPLWGKKFILAGGTGVTLFFIVSAFTLTHSMRLRAQEPIPLLGFYIRRIFRVAPLFYIWVIISLMRDKFIFGASHSWETILINMTFGFNFLPGKHEGLVWAGWTLGVEMIFYLIFPLIYRYVNDIWKAFGFFLATLTLSSIFSDLIKSYLPMEDSIRSSFLQFNFIQHLPTFILGILVYYLYEQHILNKPRSGSWAFVLVSASIFVYYALLDGRLQILLGGLYWQGIAYGMLVLGLAILPFGLFINRITCFFGKISYSLYLNHPTLVFILIPVYRMVYGWTLSTTLKYGICFLLTLATLTLISYGTYHLIERPGMRLGSNLAKKLAQTFNNAEQ